MSHIAQISGAKQANQALIDLLAVEMFNTGYLALLDQVAEADLCVHYPQASACPCGLEQVKRAFNRMHAAFPDAYFITEDLIATNNRIVIRWTGRATHTGTFWGISPTGQLVTWTGVTIYRLVADKIAEIWIHADALCLWQQLKGERIPDKSSG